MNTSWERIRSLSWKQVGSLCGMAGGIQFIIITILIAIIYPGGYSFWDNTFSELGQTETNGQSSILNYILFATACTVAAVCIVLLWLSLRTAFTETRLLMRTGRAGTISGLIAAPFLALLGLLPRDRLYDPHLLATRLFFVFYALGMVIYSIAIFYNSDYEKRYAYIGIAVAILCLAYILIFQGSDANAAVQKLAVYALVSWSAIQGYKLWKIVD